MTTTWLKDCQYKDTKQYLTELLEFCHSRALYLDSQCDHSGRDMQRSKCMQSRAAEARYIRDSIRRILEHL